MAFGKRAQSARPQDLRRATRQDVSIAATARTIEGSPVDIVIEDLSISGFRATIPLRLRDGMLLRVRLPNGRSPHARVVRVEGEQIGCEFIAPLDGETLAILLA